MQRGVPIRSASRTLAILQIINQGSDLTVMDIADRSNLPYPTVRRIVKTLMHEHFIECDEDTKRYRPTALVKSLSHGYRDHSALIKVARPYLESFTKEHMWPVSIVTRVGQMMVVRDSTHSVSAMALTNYRAGAVFPLLECASGHVCLAHSSHSERDALLRGAEQSEIKIDPFVLSRLRNGKFAHSIRESGYALATHNRFTDTPGRTSSIAVPILENGVLLASLVIVYFAVAMKSEMAMEKYLLELRDLSDQISKAHAIESESDHNNRLPDYTAVTN